VSYGSQADLLLWTSASCGLPAEAQSAKVGWARSAKGDAFQACLIDRSSISPFRINNLQHRLKDDCADCDTSPNVPRSLTGSFSIAVDVA
jgi:hypothetical protein